MKIAMQKEPIDKFSDNDFGQDVTGTTVGIVGWYPTDPRII